MPYPTAAAQTEAAARFHQTILCNPWLQRVRKPHHKQAVFLLHDLAPEVLLGGAAGGAKSDGLLMAALQYAQVPGYAALILRETYTDLSLPGALMDRAREWLHGTAARWADKEKTWHLPCGPGQPDATLSFGYLETDDGRYRYQSSEFQLCAYDELTQFTEVRYTYLFSRLRKPDWTCRHCGRALVRAWASAERIGLGGPWQHKAEGLPPCLTPEPAPLPLSPYGMALPDVPLRMRAATNPGGRGHDWCRERFIPDEFRRAPHPERFARVWHKGGRLFVPARLEDNPSVNRETYVAGLQNLDPITRAQLLAGDWDAYQGGRFQRDWFLRRWRVDARGHYAWNRREADGSLTWDKSDSIVPVLCWRFLTVDPAATEKQASDYTVIGVFAVTNKNLLLVLDWRREHLAIDRIPDAIADLCAKWEPAWVGIEAVSGFQALLATCRADVRLGAVREFKPGGKSKLARATPAIIKAEAGQLLLPETAPWVDDLMTELVQFTGDAKQDAYDDQVDALGWAALAMTTFAGTADVAQGVKDRALSTLATDSTHSSDRGHFGRGAAEQHGRGWLGR